MQVDLTIDQAKMLIGSATDCTMIGLLEEAIAEAQRKDEEEHGDIDDKWGSLDEDLRYALVRWYNHPNTGRACLSDDGLGGDVRRALIELTEAGRFWFWNCVICQQECTHGEPEDWLRHKRPVKRDRVTDYQKVNGQDYKSYPGNPKVFTAKALVSMCDDCRNDYDDTPEKCPPVDIMV